MKVSKLAKRLDFSSAIRRNEVWLFVEMWTDLESVIQSEVSQIEKNTYHVLVHICGIYKMAQVDQSVGRNRDTDVENG